MWTLIDIQSDPPDKSEEDWITHPGAALYERRTAEILRTRAGVF